MTLTITENYIDSTGYRRVRILRDTGESLMLRFPPGTTLQQMKDKAQELLDIETNTSIINAAERNRLKNITNAIISYRAGDLTLNQKGSLLDALAQEWENDYSRQK